jgi:hypothetical protein
MKQEEFEAKREEFLALFNQVAAIPRPLYDYSKLSNSTFAAIEFIRRLMEIQAFFMAHFRVTRKLPATKKDITHILVASMDLNPTQLAAIYCRCPDDGLVGLLVNLKIEELFVGAELEKRLADKRIGTVMILAPFFTGESPTEKWLTKALKVDKIKAYRPHEQEKHDIQYDSITRAYELARSLELRGFEPGPIPPFPLEMTPYESSFWEAGLGNVWRKGHDTLRRGLIPVLQGEAERIPAKVREYRREQWRKIKERGKLFESHQDVIRSELHPEEQLKTPDVSAKMFEVLREAKKNKRWGDKAVKAFKHYLEGKTEEEAAKLAGITDKTFRNYITYLKKTFASKK